MYICNSDLSGKWGHWGKWSKCSVSCGGGVLSRSRQCSNPAPAHTDDSCTGSITESSSCGDKPCPGEYISIIFKIFTPRAWPRYIQICVNMQDECNTVSQEPQCARFRRVFTCSPIVYIHITQCILPGFVNSVYMPHCGNDETGWNLAHLVSWDTVFNLLHKTLQTRGPRDIYSSPDNQQQTVQLETRCPWAFYRSPDNQQQTVQSEKRQPKNERIQINACVVGNTSVCWCEPLVWRRILSKEKPFHYLFFPRPRSTRWNIWPKPIQEWHHSK